MRSAREVLEYYRRLAEGTPLPIVWPGTTTPIYWKEASLMFHTQEILDDVAQLAFVEGDVMPAESNHERHQVQDIVEDGNRDRVMRVIDLAVAELTNMMYPYSKMPSDDGEYRVNHLMERDMYVIDLTLPDDFAESTLSYLNKLMHEFIVCRVMDDWMSITNLGNKESALNWTQRIEDLQSRIGSAMNTRIRRVRRSQTPF